ncbi:outer membrane usher protein [Superficieibacter sp. HKU1]|uniref:outer membrane usher protein n=1 Tax=Superficieibacter sp. HKU1 TaxID=3031919 RepID=UPI003204C0C2
MDRLSVHFRMKILWQAISCCLLAYCAPTWAEEAMDFDPSFLMGKSATSVDLSRYSEGNATLPGHYTVVVYLNSNRANSIALDFFETDKKHSAIPCISSAMLTQLHIKQPEKLESNDVLLKKETAAQDCLNLQAIIPQSTVRYDNSDQRLDITVPQAALMQTYSNYVDPSLWEDGVNAGLFSYNMNGWHSENQSYDTDSFYLGMMAGFNLGNWHFRSQGNYSWTKNGESDFQYQNRYLQHDIEFLRSQLVVGETYTTGETFDSVNLRGIRIYSEDRMLPPVLASYAPIIRGIANSNAKVTITQNGYKVYETSVPPGPFTIDDITPSSYGADLIVTIEEADGSKRTFSQPFSSVTQMLRPGVGRWDAGVGQVNDDNLHDKPGLAQGTFYYGLTNTFTGYAGLQATDNGYYAGLAGLGMNTSLGAFSLDVTHSSTDIPGDKNYNGQSYRLSWNKYFTPTNTSLNIAAYRYSTKNYLGLNDALTLIDEAKHPDKDDNNQGMANFSRMKNQFSVNINQTLQDGEQSYGSFYLTGTWTDYWATNNTQSDYSLGYSNAFSWASYSIGVQRSYDEDNKKDDSIYLSLTIPLENLFGGERNSSGFRTLNTSANSDLNGNHQMTMSTNGNSENNLWNYSLNAGYNMNKDDKDISSIGTFVGYESPWGTLSGSVSASSDNSRQYSLNTDGGFVLHRNGLTFSNDSFSASDTLGIIDAPGAKGARINYGNSTVNRFGQGITTSLSPYRENTIFLDISKLDNDIELKNTSATTVPKMGAVVTSRFDTDQGRSAIINVVRSDNQPMPFAASVYDTNGNALGVIGQGSQAFVRGINESGDLRVEWLKDGKIQSCRIHYQIPASPKMQGKSVVLNTVPCQMP